MSGRYMCFIELFEYNNDYIANSIRNEFTKDGRFNLCVDFQNCARHFDTTEQAIQWAKSHGLKDGEFGVRCYWIEQQDNNSKDCLSCANSFSEERVDGNV